MVHPGHGAKVTTQLAALRRVGAMAARELALTALLLLGVSLVVFVILHLSPGDPFSVLLEGQAPGGAARASVREALGVPTTWYGRYLAWLGNMAHGNLGTSSRTGVPVAGEIVRAGPNTLYLTLGSLLVTLLLAVPLALYSAWRRSGALARALTLAVYLISAVPVFWLGYVVIYLCIHRFGLFPLLSATAEPQRHGWLYILLPIIVLGVANGTVSEVTRHLREELGRVMAEDYIRTARAKGAPVWRHAFKEGFLLPMTEMIAAKMPYVLGAVGWLPDDPARMDMARLNAPPGPGHALGTDFLGRDMLSRLIVGIQAYFLPGLLAVATSLALGATLGVVAGYRDGRAEALVTYLSNLVDSFPRLVLILLVIAAFRADIYYVMLVVGITGAPAIASLIAGKIQFLRTKSFIEAAHVLGLSTRVIVVKHILWYNCAPLLIIQATLGMGEAILVETSLSYLGFGVQEPTPSWGNMVQAGANYFFHGKFWPSTAPALAILGTILGFHLLGDGLNNILESKSAP